MSDSKSIFRTLIADAINEIIKEKMPETPAVNEETVVVQDSPDPKMGDLGSPMFVFAKSLRMAPPAIARYLKNKELFCPKDLKMLVKNVHEQCKKLILNA